MFHVKQSLFDSAKNALKNRSLTPKEANDLGWSVNQDGQRRSLWQFLSYPDISLKSVLDVFPDLHDLDDQALKQAEIEAGYASYIERQASDVQAMRRDEALRLPKDLEYSRIGGLSNEVRLKLETVKPETIGQAGRIEGVTPGALTALLAYGILQYKREAA